MNYKCYLKVDVSGTGIIDIGTNTNNSYMLCYKNTKTEGKTIIHSYVAKNGHMTSSTTDLLIDFCKAAVSTCRLSIFAALLVIVFCKHLTLPGHHRSCFLFL